MKEIGLDWFFAYSLFAGTYLNYFLWSSETYINMSTIRKINLWMTWDGISSLTAYGIFNPLNFWVCIGVNLIFDGLRSGEPCQKTASDWARWIGKGCRTSRCSLEKSSSLEPMQFQSQGVASLARHDDRVASHGVAYRSIKNIIQSSWKDDLRTMHLAMHMKYLVWPFVDHLAKMYWSQLDQLTKGKFCWKWNSAHFMRCEHGFIPKSISIQLFPR